MSLLETHRGDNETFSVTCTNNGVAVNLTGVALRFTAKWRTSDTDANAAIVKVSGYSTEIEVTDAAAGEANVYLVPGDTSGFTDQQCRNSLRWDIQSSDTEVNTLASGRLRVYPDVSTTTDIGS